MMTMMKRICSFFCSLLVNIKDGREIRFLEKAMSL